MDGVRKMVRSGSLIVEELFGNKTARRTETEPAEVEYESGFSGESGLHYQKYNKKLVYNNNKKLTRLEAGLYL